MLKTCRSALHRFALRVRSSETGSFFPRFERLQQPALFHLERSRLIGHDYPEYYFLVQIEPYGAGDDKVVLCWFKAKYWDEYEKEHEETARWPCKQESPYRGILRLNTIEAVYVRAAPKGAGDGVENGIYIDAVNSDHPGDFLEFFGKEQDAEDWVGNLKHVIGLSPDVAAEAARQHHVSKLRGILREGREAF